MTDDNWYETYLGIKLHDSQELNNELIHRHVVTLEMLKQSLLGVINKIDNTVSAFEDDYCNQLEDQ